MELTLNYCGFSASPSRMQCSLCTQRTSEDGSTGFITIRFTTELNSALLSRSAIRAPDHHHRQVAALLVNEFRQLDAIGRENVEVEHDAAAAASRASQEGHRFSAALCDIRFDALPVKRDGQQPSGRRFVINDENAVFRRRRHIVTERFSIRAAFRV